MEKKTEFYIYLSMAIFVVAASIICMTIAFRAGGWVGITAGIIMVFVAISNLIWIIVPVISAVVGHKENKYETVGEDIEESFKEIVEDSYNIFRRK